jgi:hypothetical protein
MKYFIRLTACSLFFTFTFMNADKKPQSNNKTFAYAVRTLQVLFTLQVTPNNQPFKINNSLPVPPVRPQ